MVVGATVVVGFAVVVVATVVVLAVVVVGAEVVGAAVLVGPTRSVVVVASATLIPWGVRLLTVVSSPAASATSATSMKNPAVLTASHGQVLDQPERCSAGSPSCIEAGSDQGGGWSPAPAPGPCGCAFHTEGSGGDPGNGGGVASDAAWVPVAVGGPT